MEIDKENLKSLATQIKKGDMSLFDSFYNLTKSVVYFNIMKIVNDFDKAEDLLQDTYIYFLNNIKKIDTDHSPLGYLLVVSRHVSLDYLKSIKKEMQLEDFGLDYYADEPEYEDLVDRLKNILNEEDLNLFLLHAKEDITFKELAIILDKPIGTLTWKYNEIIKKLRKELSENEIYQ